MSGAAGGNPPQRRGSFASRKARGEQGGTASSSTKVDKSHGYDARQYHQNANTRGIIALRTFDCPVCDSKNTIRVDLHAAQREGTVRCTYCMSLRPIPEDLPYPYSTSFVPGLENKADVFFKFNEMYTALLEKQRGHDELEGGRPGSSTTTRGAEDTVSRKRAREAGDDDDDGGSSSGGAGGGGGLLGGLGFLAADPDGLDSVMPELNFVSADADGDAEGGPAAPPETREGEEDEKDELGGDGEMGGVDEVDIADFFADSD